MNYESKLSNIKEQLPGGSRIGFLFEVNPTDAVVFYVEATGRIQQAYFEDGTLQVNMAGADTSGVAAMMDDGLDELLGKTKQSTVSRAASHNPKAFWNNFHDKFRTTSIAESELISIFLQEMGMRQTNYSNDKLAIGDEIVFLKPSSITKIIKLERSDWDLGDSILRAIRENPPQYMDSQQLHCQNIATLLDDVRSEVADHFPTHISQRIVARTWKVISERLSVAEYHPELSPKYDLLKQVCFKFVSAEV